MCDRVGGGIWGEITPVTGGPVTLLFSAIYRGGNNSGKLEGDGDEESTPKNWGWSGHQMFFCSRILIIEYINPYGIGLMTIPLLYGNHGSLDPGTYKLIERPSGKTWPNTWQIT